MAAAGNQHRIASVLTRVACGFSTFLLAVFLSTHYNPLGTRDLDSQLLPIVVAKLEIPVGTRIKAEQLTVRQFPRTVLPAGTFAKLEDKILGRVAAVRIRPGEPVTEGRLAPVGSVGGVTFCPPDGYRAVTVQVDDVVSVSGFIMPGTFVDIVVTITQPGSSKQRENVSKIVAQNVKVLASNHHRPKNVKGVQAVTLQVTPDQAEKLALASGEGKLQLVMRSPIE